MNFSPFFLLSIAISPKFLLFAAWLPQFVLERHSELDFWGCIKPYFSSVIKLFQTYIFLHGDENIDKQLSIFQCWIFKLGVRQIWNCKNVFSIRPLTAPQNEMVVQSFFELTLIKRPIISSRRLSFWTFIPQYETQVAVAVALLITHIQVHLHARKTTIGSNKGTHLSPERK